MENVMDRETGYIEDACVCCHSNGKRIDGDECPVHGDNPIEEPATCERCDATLGTDALDRADGICDACYEDDCRDDAGDAAYDAMVEDGL
jgi:hypothetical protein